MTDETFKQEIATAAQHWREWLVAHHLSGLAITLLDILEPFGLFGAQLLYVFQPLFDRERLQVWAQLLETPGGLAWLRQELMAPSSTEDTSHARK